MRTLSHMDSLMCSSTPNPEMWIIQDTLAWHTSPVWTRVWNQTYPQEDRWGDSGEIQCRSNFLFTHGIQAIQGDHYGSSLLENSYIPYQYMGSHLWSTGLGLASMEKNEAPNNVSLQTKNYEIAPFILGWRRDRTTRAFFHAFLRGLEKISINRIFLILLERKNVKFFFL